MSEVLTEHRPGSADHRAPSAVVDSYVHHQWNAQLDFYEYLPEGWREYLGRPGVIRGGRGMAAALPKPDAAPSTGLWLADAGSPGGRLPGSDLATLQAQLLDPHRICRAVLGFDGVMNAPTFPNAGYAHDIVRAANDWSVGEWLSGQDDRLYGLGLVPNHLPELAAAEIRRIGQHPRIVGLLMAGNGLSKFFGHPLYHPIYDAAADMGLPIVIHVGGDSPPNTLSHATAGGLPSTFAEHYAMRSQSISSHLLSIMVQGVLERHRSLKIMIVGAGLTWIPGLLWRSDSDFRQSAPREAPWMKRPPSEQFIDQVKVTTYSNRTAPSPEALRRYLSPFEGIENVITFASGYPRWDTDVAERVVASFPLEWRHRVMSSNALDFYRWPD
jgi:uncharacterized protein